MLVGKPCMLLYISHDCSPRRHSCTKASNQGSLQRFASVSSTMAFMQSMSRSQNMSMIRLTWCCSCLKGLQKIAVCITGGSCHQSTKKRRFLPPQGRTSGTLPRLAGRILYVSGASRVALRTFASKTPRFSQDAELPSSIKINWRLSHFVYIVLTSGLPRFPCACRISMCDDTPA